MVFISPDHKGPRLFPGEGWGGNIYARSRPFDPEIHCPNNSRKFSMVRIFGRHPAPGTYITHVNTEINYQPQLMICINSHPTTNPDAAWYLQINFPLVNATIFHLSNVGTFHPIQPEHLGTVPLSWTQIMEVLKLPNLPKHSRILVYLQPFSTGQPMMVATSKSNHLANQFLDPNKIPSLGCPRKLGSMVRISGL